MYIITIHLYSVYCATRNATTIINRNVDGDTLQNVSLLHSGVKVAAASPDCTRARQTILYSIVVVGRRRTAKKKKLTVIEIITVIFYTSGTPVNSYMLIYIHARLWTLLLSRIPMGNYTYIRYVYHNKKV